MTESTIISIKEIASTHNSLIELIQDVDETYVLKSRRANRDLGQTVFTELCINAQIKKHPSPFLCVATWVETINDRARIYLPLGEGLDVSLDAEIATKPPHTEIYFKQILPFSKDILQGILYLHQDLKIMHLDLKTENILIIDGHATIADFGMSRPVRYPCKLHALQHEVYVTWCYRPPECYYSSIHLSTSVDIWSFGILLTEIFFLLRNGIVYVGADTHKDRLKNAYLKMFGPPSEIWLTKYASIEERSKWLPLLDPEYLKKLPPFVPLRERKEFTQHQHLFTPDFYNNLMDVIEGCLKYDPCARWTIYELMAHPFFREICDSWDVYCASTIIRPTTPPIGEPLTLHIGFHPAFAKKFREYAPLYNEAKRIWNQWQNDLKTRFGLSWKDLKCLVDKNEEFMYTTYQWACLKLACRLIYATNEFSISSTYKDLFPQDKRLYIDIESDLLEKEKQIGNCFEWQFLS
jgi:serine/threonine protein kinase